MENQIHSEITNILLNMFFTIDLKYNLLEFIKQKLYCLHPPPTYLAISLLQINLSNVEKR